MKNKKNMIVFFTKANISDSYKTSMSIKNINIKNTGTLNLHHIIVLQRRGKI